MRFQIRLLDIKSVDKIDNYWTVTDYRNLLEAFEYTDGDSTSDDELFDILSMAITDYEPADAAEIILTYKLKEKLSAGQIQNVAHDMLEDKIAEEYPDISMHYALFNINQLLYAAYNGKFPRTLASVITFELKLAESIEVSKEIVLRTMSDLLTEKSLLKRLFDDQLDASEELTDANSVIWELKHKEANTYKLITSDYWLNREDFGKQEHSGVLRDDEIHDSTKD